MSEILYLYGELDARVRPLVFFIRRWAKAMNIVEEVRPTLKPTNFTVTLMVLFFLQQKKILPPFEKLKSLEYGFMKAKIERWSESSWQGDEATICVLVALCAI